jgi:hypothetical protein
MMPRRGTKRFYLFGAIACSVMLWFASLNLAFTGHTNLIKTTDRAIHKVDRAGAEMRGMIHGAEGDRGQHVQ